MNSKLNCFSQIWNSCNVALWGSGCLSQSVCFERNLLFAFFNWLHKNVRELVTCWLSITGVIYTEMLFLPGIFKLFNYFSQILTHTFMKISGINLDSRRNIRYNFQAILFNSFAVENWKNLRSSSTNGTCNTLARRWRYDKSWK